jgi:hypothetical protein
MMEKSKKWMALVAVAGGTAMAAALVAQQPGRVATPVRDPVITRRVPLAYRRMQ